MTTPPDIGRFYGLAYAPDGMKLHECDDAWKDNQYWNDACWHECVPLDARGLTYLDVGCAEGNYLLRFEQRGGEATGLNFHGDGQIITDGIGHPELGNEAQAPRYQYLKELWQARYKVLIGGFNHDGTLQPPNLPKANIVACLNVLEYITSPREAVAALFEQAMDRVLIATDVIFKGKTGHPGIEPIIQQVFLLDDLISWCPWPAVFWTHTVMCDGRPWPQAFICATRDGAFLTPDTSKIQFNREMTATQKHWLSIQTPK